MTSDERLFQYVRHVRGNKRATAWWGHSGSTGSVRRYTCYICREVFATESAMDGRTKRADKALVAHREYHVDALMTDDLPELVGKSVALVDGLTHLITEAYDGETARVVFTRCGQVREGDGPTSTDPPTCFSCLSE